MTRKNIVDNKFILYEDQIGLIKDALVSHKYTITNIMEHSMKKGDLNIRISGKVLYKTSMSSTY